MTGSVLRTGAPLAATPDSSRPSTDLPSPYRHLGPGEYSSGCKRMPGSVTKRGNPRLRSALVECAWRLVRFQPQYPPVKQRLGVLAKGARATGAARKKAIVAVARHLAVDLWRLHTGRCTAGQLGLIN